MKRGKRKMDKKKMYGELLYYVRTLLREGSDTYDAEVLAKRWVKNQKADMKKKRIMFYQAYHIIASLLPVWAEREGVEISLEAETKGQADAGVTREAKVQMKEKGFQTLIPFGDLKEDEILKLRDHFVDGRTLPEYLRTILEQKKDSGESTKKSRKDKMNGFNTMFIAMFVLVVMLLNL
jgi:hypothetical protein